jgi:microcystin-dependent protein
MSLQSRLAALITAVGADIKNHETRLTSVEAKQMPPGLIMPYASNPAPTGWLLCQGQAVSRTTYSDLFAVIGTTYGLGDGSTTFNVPNLVGRTVMGYDPSGGDPDFGSFGHQGGEKTHVLTAAEIPSHLHAVGTLTNASDPAHAHGGATSAKIMESVNSTTATGTAPRVSDIGGLTGGGGTNFNLSFPIPSQAAHTHALSGSTANTGGGAAHNVLQPFIALPYIIKT